jgi:hypothetical protein
VKYWFKPLNTKNEWLWASSRAQCNFCEDTKGIVAYKDDQIVGAVILDSWSHNSVSIHLTIEDPLILKNGFPEEVFNYVFNTCDRGIILGATPADNLKALKFNKHIGFKEVYRVKDGYKVGVDFVIFELRKEDCRYIEHGKEEHSCAA